MRIAVIDADLIGRKRHRFPNLACMKLAGYHRDAGDAVELKTDYDPEMSRYLDMRYDSMIGAIT